MRSTEALSAGAWNLTALNVTALNTAALNMAALNMAALHVTARNAAVLSTQAAAYVPNRATAAVDPTKGSSAT
ncbi:hypothetical protein CA983_22865 [Streptomyces swartbergensis]|uniref:Uncharacterized protein n=1 Tax=Streptomyces swartbergensis TaxID=487165 RepID=A0A2C9ZMY9_9ACTN|nr:hypothetical protein CA983_22865 [Streptomyces swartbergensis]